MEGRYQISGDSAKDSQILPNTTSRGLQDMFEIKERMMTHFVSSKDWLFFKHMVYYIQDNKILFFNPLLMQKINLSLFSHLKNYSILTQNERTE